VSPTDAEGVREAGAVARTLPVPDAPADGEEATDSAAGVTVVDVQALRDPEARMERLSECAPLADAEARGERVAVGEAVARGVAVEEPLAVRGGEEEGENEALPVGEGVRKEVRVALGEPEPVPLRVGWMEADVAGEGEDAGVLLPPPPSPRGEGVASEEPLAPPLTDDCGEGVAVAEPDEGSDSLRSGDDEGVGEAVGDGPPLPDAGAVHDTEPVDCAE
jgi:hypothetical protein